MGMLDIFWLLGLLGNAAAIGGDALSPHWVNGQALVFFVKNRDYSFAEIIWRRPKRFIKNTALKQLFWRDLFPIIRTFAPFVAGIGKIQYKRFFSYNVSSAACFG